MQLEICTFNNLSYLLAGIKNLPSSKCISLFSKRLFNTGRTLRSAFSMPSKIKILPSIAARTAP